MSSIITALFSNHSDAAASIHTLEHRGFTPSQISMIASDDFNKEEFGIDSHSKLPEGVAIGAASVGAVGAVVARLTAVGAIATGGAGLLVAGPLVAASAGAGAGAATGGVLGGLVGIAIPEHEIKHYENSLKEGSVLVGVDCKSSDDKARAKKTFEHFDADKIATA